MDTHQTYLSQTREALQLSMMSPEKAVRDNSMSFLKAQYANPVFFSTLFEIVNSPEFGEIQNLQAAIFVTKFIQTEYVKAEGSFKFDLQEAMLRSFLNHPAVKVRNQLRVGITRLVITDFPKSKIFELLIESLTEEKLMQMTDEQISTMCALYYFVFKALHADKYNDHKLKQYVVNYFNLKQGLFVKIIAASFAKFSTFTNPSVVIGQDTMKQVQSQVSLTGLRYAIKFLNMENLLSIHTQAELGECVLQLHTLQSLTHSFCSLVNLHNSIEQQEELFSFIHSLRQILRMYHKYFLGVVGEKRTTATKCIVVLEYLKAHYFLNGNNLILNNESFVNTKQLTDTSLLSKLQSQPKLVQFFEDECNLIIQSLDFCSDLIQELGLRAVQHLFSSDSDQIEVNCDDETVICEYFDQNYFQIVLEFLLKKVLQLNWSQLALISIEPERAFSEEKGEETTGIRQAGVNLLRVLLQNVNEDKMMELLNQLLIKYNSSVCSGKEPFSEVLEREAFYFIMNGLYKDIKNSIDFEAWFENVLATELIISNDCLIPLKAQILNLVYNFLENSYQITQEIAQTLFATIAALMIGEDQSLYIRLLSMKCFVPLIDSSADLMINVEQLMGGVSKLFNTCTESESKMLLLDFVKNLIVLMKHAEPHIMESVYQFLHREWQEACESDDKNLLSLKAQITQVLSQIIVKVGLDVKQIKFIAEVAKVGMELEEQSEIYMIENSCRLLYFFTKDLNRKLSEDYPSNELNMPKIKESDIYTPYDQALQERQFLLSQAEIIEKILLLFVQQTETIFIERQNLFHTTLLILIELINSPFESVAQAVGRSLTKGITVNLNEIKDELFCFIFDAIEYLQIAYPISSAQVVEQAVLALISESIKQAMFGDVIKLYVLRIIGRAFFNNLSIGQSHCDKIAASFREPDFLHNLLGQTATILEQLKPELYFYRMQYSCVLSVVQILVTTHNNSNNNAAIDSHSKMGSMLDSYVSELDKILHILKTNYEKSLVQEQHWIITNILKLLSVENIIDPSEVNLLRVNLITKTLNKDKLRRIDFAQHTKAFFAQNHLVPSIEIDFDKLSLE